MKIREYLSVVDDISGKPFLIEERGIEVPEGTRLFSPKPIVSFMNQNYMMNRLTDERAYVIAFDTSGGVVGVFLAGKGNVSGSLVSTHSIIRDTLLLNASSVVLIHNHPSWDIKPSQADIKFSRYLKKAARLLEIKLADSIIIGRNSYYSMEAEGGIW